MSEPNPKPLFWIASARSELKALPPDVRHTMGFALWRAQNGARHVDAKPLRGFGGSDVLKVVEDHAGNAYRAVYTVRFAGAVYVLHAFQKKSTRGVQTPRHVMELVRRRL
jgi:phage-related protein